MSYTQGYMRRKHPFFSDWWYGKPKKRSAKKRKAASVRSIVRQMLHPEVKYHDSALSTTTFSTGNMHLLSGGYLVDIDQFDDDTGNPSNQTRLGNKVTLKNVDFFMTLRQNASSTSCAVRVVIVRDKQNTSSTVLSVDDVFEAASSNPYNAHYDHDNMRGLQILHDKIYTLDAVNKPMINARIGLKINKILSYTGIAGTDYGDGGIYVFVGCSDSTNRPNIQYNARCTFTDV